jgi:hypothetical protein
MKVVLVGLGANNQSDGTVALSATGAEPAPIGAANEHQFRGAHVFTMHFNTGFSAQLMPCAGWCGSMQQCPNNRVEADHGRLKARLRPMRGLKRDRTASVIIEGHTFIQNLRRGHYELGVNALPGLTIAAAFDELALVV